MFVGEMVHQSISGIEEVGFFSGIHGSGAPSMMESSLRCFCSLQVGLPSGLFGFEVGGCTKFSGVFHFLVCSVVEAVVDMWGGGIASGGWAGVADLCALRLCRSASGLPCWLRQE